jgi:MoxR-like ATPase
MTENPKVISWQFESGGATHWHLFSDDEWLAINTAIDAGRALLVRGEPGVGKTQLAAAAAKCLGRRYVPFVTDSRTESRDLMWHFDAVERLAQAQLQSAHGKVEERLQVANFVRPGALWWAFDWDRAADQPGATPPPQFTGNEAAQGVVVLIDEIDKADTDVPNGLLEALGSGSFTPYGITEPVRAKQPPLVIITTNEERTLPDAFIRRCLVLHMNLPQDRARFIEHLVDRGRVQFQIIPDLEQPPPEDDPEIAVLTKAAELVWRDRETARDKRWLPLPGQAEFMDLVRAVRNKSADPGVQASHIDAISKFMLRKHPDAGKAS